MRCSNCGHKIKPDTSFCTKCGRKIDVNPETVDDKKGQLTMLFLLNSNYCYTHSPSTSSGLSYKPESAEDVLSFSAVNIEHNYSYTVCNAKITNNGRKTYSFVKVKGKFKDSSGNVINTDWTYAVGSEGLAPGETKSFRLLVDKCFSIKSCSLEIMDYTKE